MESKNFFVHDRAICESAQIGAGTRIWAFAHVMPGAVIGKHCNLGENVFVENNVTLGNHCTIKNGVALWSYVTLEDGVFVGPNAVFTNDLRPRAFIKRAGDLLLPTLVKRGATIGANATLVCGITLGEYSMIGAGAVVHRDVPAHTLLVGNPARRIGKICFCGERLDQREFCKMCGLSLTQNSERTAADRVAEQAARRS